MNKLRLPSCGDSRALQVAGLKYLVLLFFSTCSFTVFAQQAAEKKITSVEYVGLAATRPAYAQDIGRLKGGDSFGSPVLDDAVRRLLATGRFLSVSYQTQDEADGVRVVFEIVERAVVQSIRFEGNSKYRTKVLEELVPLKVGQTIDWFAIREGREAILAKYREDGFSDVALAYNEQEINRTGEVVFRISEGEKAVVRNIRFEGNASIDESELKKQIESKTSFWIFRSGAFDENRVEADVGRVRSYYRDQGFLDAKVSHQRRTSEDGKSITLIFSIEEGTLYIIEDVKFTGHSVFTTEELRGLIKSGEERPVKQPELDTDAKAIATRYGELGYIEVGVRVSRVFSDRPGFVRVTFDISEGGQFRIGRVAVRGNTRTRDKVVRRALELYPPDDLFNLTETREAEKRLLDTRIFSSARVLPIGDQAGVRDAVIDVVENEKAGDVIFGFGVTSNSGLIGQVVLDFVNFDIWDRPRSLSEFFKFRSFFGGGQRLRVELQPGTDVSRFRIDFTEPYLFDKPLRYDASFYLFERGRDGYDEGRIGSTSSIGKRFERGLFRGWSGEIALRSENVNVDGVDLFASDQIRDDEGSNLLIGVKGTMLRDRTDSRFVPTTGDRFRISYQQFAGDHIFGELTAAYQWYKTMRTDALERKSVLQLRGEGGIIVGDAPVFERFFAGGTGSLRGFEYRGVGPRDGLQKNNVGGETLLLGGAEYSYPVWGDNLRGHVFLDMGTIDSGRWRAAVGTGIRLTLNLLGPLPLEFNIGVPVAKDGDDDVQVFSFIVGTTF